MEKYIFPSLDPGTTLHSPGSMDLSQEEFGFC